MFIVGIIDSQSVRIIESGGLCGYDVGKKIMGCKCYIVIDIFGLMVGIEVYIVDIQDCDGVLDLFNLICVVWFWLCYVFVDGGYVGLKFKGRLEKFGKWMLQIVKCFDIVQGFEILFW